MTRWTEGRAYDYYGTKIRCLSRWFDGPLEMVLLGYELAPGESAVPERIVYDGLSIKIVAGNRFTRTARSLASCVFPRVTDTLGGVTDPRFCSHECFQIIRADAGPHVGELCCSGCGAPTLPHNRRPGPG